MNQYLQTGAARKKNTLVKILGIIYLKCLSKTQMQIYRLERGRTRSETEWWNGARDKCEKKKKKKERSCKINNIKSQSLSCSPVCLGKWTERTEQMSNYRVYYFIKFTRTNRCLCFRCLNRGKEISFQLAMCWMQICRRMRNKNTIQFISNKFHSRWLKITWQPEPIPFKKAQIYSLRWKDGFPYFRGHLLKYMHPIGIFQCEIISHFHWLFRFISCPI